MNIGVDSLSSALNQLSKLTSLKLNLQSNHIGEEGAGVLSQTLNQLKNLTFL